MHEDIATNIADTCIGEGVATNAGMDYWFRGDTGWSGHGILCGCISNLSKQIIASYMKSWQLAIF